MMRVTILLLCKINHQENLIRKYAVCGLFFGFDDYLIYLIALNVLNSLQLRYDILDI